jgi:hypothetical protein
VCINGDFAGIDASGLGLTGSVPADVYWEDGSWGRMTTMRLEQNKLQSTLPPGLGELIRLEHFDCSENLLTGVLPPLDRLTALTYLSLANNNFLGLLNVSANTKLETLLLSSNTQLHGTLDLTQLTSLTRLRVGGTRFFKVLLSPAATLTECWTRNACVTNCAELPSVCTENSCTTGPQCPSPTPQTQPTTATTTTATTGTLSTGTTRPTTTSTTVAPSSTTRTTSRAPTGATISSSTTTTIVTGTGATTTSTTTTTAASNAKIATFATKGTANLADEGVPGWAIGVAVAGGVILLVLVIVLIVCASKGTAPKKSQPPVEMQPKASPPPEFTSARDESVSGNYGNIAAQSHYAPTAVDFRIEESSNYGAFTAQQAGEQKESHYAHTGEDFRAPDSAHYEMIDDNSLVC